MDLKNWGPQMLRKKWPENASDAVLSFFNATTMAAAMGCTRQQVKTLIRKAALPIRYCTATGDPLWPVSELEAFRRAFTIQRQHDRGVFLVPAEPAAPAPAPAPAPTLQ
jgi:hypothetical protein